MPLLVNGDWNSTDDDKKIRSGSSDHAESNCDGHATPAPNRAPKAANPSTADQWQAANPSTAPSVAVVTFAGRVDPVRFLLSLISLYL